MVRDQRHNVKLLAPPVSPKVVARSFSPESSCDPPACFRTIVDLAQEGIVLLDKEARITFINKWLADMLGSEAEKLCGRSLLDFVGDGGSAILTAQMEQCRQGSTEAAVLNLRWRDGNLRVVLVSVVPREEDGDFQGYLAAVTDIARLKELERELRSAKEFRDTVFNSITDNLIVIEPATCRVVLANDSFVRWMGLESETVLDRRCFEVMHNKQASCQEEGYFCPVKETARITSTRLRRTRILMTRGRSTWLFAWNGMSPTGAAWKNLWPFAPRNCRRRRTRWKNSPRSPENGPPGAPYPNWCNIFTISWGNSFLRPTPFSCFWMPRKTVFCPWMIVPTRLPGP
jgi:PAS domain S-box-containing protein